MTTSVSVAQLSATVAQRLATAHAGTPVDVTRRGQEYVTIVATDRLRQLETASAALVGLLRLAAREAECWEYAEHAEDLLRLVRVSGVQLPTEAMEVINEGVQRAHDHDRMTSNQ